MSSLFHIKHDKKMATNVSAMSSGGLELLTFKLETMIDKSTDPQDTTAPAITYSECYA